MTLEDVRAELKKVCINFQTVLTIKSEIKILKNHLNETQSGDGTSSNDETDLNHKLKNN